VVVIGCGGVGLNVVQGARLAGAEATSRSWSISIWPVASRSIRW
jgi:D-arabinose 1-dehydrogenase-like Zn-dependent alcohol dehydrogenase